MYKRQTYIFEVSSPGLGRPLKKEKDFARSIGEEVEIRTYRAIDRQKEFIGILKEYDQDTVTIEYEDCLLYTSKKCLLRMYPRDEINRRLDLPERICRNEILYLKHSRIR